MREICMAELSETMQNLIRECRLNERFFRKLVDRPVEFYADDIDKLLKGSLTGEEWRALMMIKSETISSPEELKKRLEEILRLR